MKTLLIISLFFIALNSDTWKEMNNQPNWNTKKINNLKKEIKDTKFSKVNKYNYKDNISNKISKDEISKDENEKKSKFDIMRSCLIKAKTKEEKSKCVPKMNNQIYFNNKDAYKKFQNMQVDKVEKFKDEYQKGGKRWN